MEENRDIYTKPEIKKDDGSSLPAYERTPDEIRASSRKQLVSFSVIMLILLGAAVYYFYTQDEKMKTSALEEALRMPVQTNAVRPPLTMKSTESLVPQVDIASDFPRAGEVQDISPQKMASAMGEVRIATDFYQARELDKAEEHARMALGIWPEMNAAVRLLGAIYIQRGQFDQAIAIMERSLKTNPFSAETLNNLATTYMQKRMLDRAEDLLLTSLQIRPDYSIANLNLGLLYILWGRHDQALEYLQLALEQMPDNPSLLNNLAVSQIRLGRFGDARSNLQRLVTLYPNEAIAYFNLAITYTLEQDYDEAVTWIQRGARFCSPADCQRYLADGDFNAIRNFPAFQAFIQQQSPNVPNMPEGPDS